MTEDTISFNEIKAIFPDDEWDVGVLSAENFKRACLAPIKYKFHPILPDYTNDIHFNGIMNAIVLIKTGHSWDYTHYEEADAILRENGMDDAFLCYTNYKEAAVLSGLGVRARNSLVYSYKFGFDCHITAACFHRTIIDLPTNKRINYKLWPHCTNCYDCVNACPVGAIKGREEPYWLDSEACDDFIGKSDHPTIPSVKQYWHKHAYPHLTKEEADEIAEKGFMPWDRNGFTYDGQVVRKNGEPVDVPVCRECTSQPRCSKWGGKFPYEQF